MGTRSLIAVFSDGKYRVAQYSQWDGYPDGQGKGCLEFLLNKMDEKKFRLALLKLRWIDSEKLERIWRDYGANASGEIKCTDANKLGNTFPEFSRDTGSDILEMVQESTITTNTLEDGLTFAADSLFCEWAYVIDLDARTFEVYQGFNERPLKPEDRFYSLREYEDERTGFHGVKIAKSWSIDDLPTVEEFIDMFDEDDEDE